MKPRFAFCCLFALTAVSMGAELDQTTAWRDFRGPHGSGHASALNETTLRGLPTSWSDTKNVTWKTKIPLTGLSSPIVDDGKVWLTTATEDGHDYTATPRVFRRRQFEATNARSARGFE